MNPIARYITYRLMDISKLLLFWKPNYSGCINKNRSLRMDANVAINDKKRRLFHIDRYKFAAEYLKEKGRENLTIIDAACVGVCRERFPYLY